MSTKVAAEEYIKNGMALCQYKSGTKGEGLCRNWNLPDQAIYRPEDIRDGNNIGLLHVSSKTCSIDLDDLKVAITYFEQKGFDLRAELDAEDAVQISSGRENRGKLIYRLRDHVDPTDMKSIVHSDNGKTIFEFRCATAEGKSNQDALPPSIHPDTNEPYKWAGKGDWRNLPALPADLLELWQGFMAQSAPNTQSKQDNDDEGEIITPRTIDELASALTFINSDNRETWVRMGMALKTLPHNKGFALFMEWSAKSKKFQQADAEEKWDSFRPSATDYKAVFAEATRHGWQNPRSKKSKPIRTLPRQIDLGSVDFEPTEFVLDGFIPTGVSSIAGAWGAGKSTNLIPLFASAAHLAPKEWGFWPDLRRHVVWITEAPGQALDTLRSLVRAEGSAAWDEYKNWFHLFPALRQSAEDMADQVKEQTEQLTYKNEWGFEIKPVVVLDTTAANLAIENESDNSQVSEAMAVLKQTLPGIPLVLVGHTPKASRKADVEELTMRGAGAWEADAAATFFLKYDEQTGMRFLQIRKCRFAPTYFEITFGEEGGSVIVDTPWGDAQNKRYLHGVPTKSNGEARKAATREARQEKIDEKKQIEQSERQRWIMNFVRDAAEKGALATRTILYTEHGGNKALFLEAVNQLEERGDVTFHEVTKRQLELFGVEPKKPYPKAIVPAGVCFDLVCAKVSSENQL